MANRTKNNARVNLKVSPYFEDFCSKLLFFSPLIVEEVLNFLELLYLNSWDFQELKILHLDFLYPIQKT